MGIDHRGADIAVPQQLLHRAYVRATLQQMRSNTRAKRYRMLGKLEGVAGRQPEHLLEL